MTVRATSARGGAGPDRGRHQSAIKSSASSTLPVKAKYRARGMPITVVMTSPEVPGATGRNRNGSGTPWSASADQQRIDLNARFIGTRHEAAIEGTGLMVVEGLKQLRTGSTFLPNHKS